MTFTEDEEKVIEAMARAATLACGQDPDEMEDVVTADPFDLKPAKVERLPYWKAWEGEARRHYAMQKAMEEEAWRMLPHECPACKVLDDCQ